MPVPRLRGSRSSKCSSRDRGLAAGDKESLRTQRERLHAVTEPRRQRQRRPPRSHPTKVTGRPRLQRGRNARSRLSSGSHPSSLRPPRSFETSPSGCARSGATCTRFSRRSRRIPRASRRSSRPSSASPTSSVASRLVVRGAARAGGGRARRARGDAAGHDPVEAAAKAVTAAEARIGALAEELRAVRRSQARSLLAEAVADELQGLGASSSPSSASGTSARRGPTRSSFSSARTRGCRSRRSPRLRPVESSRASRSPLQPSPAARRSSSTRSTPGSAASPRTRLPRRSSGWPSGRRC